VALFVDGEECRGMHCTLSFSKKAFSVTKKKSRAKAPGAMNTFSASLAKGPPGRYSDAL
jgi:hypothetical protein